MMKALLLAIQRTAVQRGARQRAMVKASVRTMRIFSSTAVKRAHWLELPVIAPFDHENIDC